MRRFFDPLKMYAARPMRFLRLPASRIIAASRPAPAMTANRSPVKRPRSNSWRAPWRPTSTAPSTFLRMPRFAATRLALLAGMIVRLVRSRRARRRSAASSRRRPGKNEIGALVEDAANALRRLATLGTSCRVNDGGLEPYLTLVDATARKHGSEQPSGCHDGLLRLQRVPGCGGGCLGCSEEFRPRRRRLHSRAVRHINRPLIRPPRRRSPPGAA